ncbi:MAG TPA: hypothetical protein VGD67_23060 [Pseudonocardiaceae bacterium]
MIAVATVAGLATGGCAAGARDPLQVADTLAAAVPATSPPAAGPDGRVLPLPAAVTGAAATAAVVEPDSGTLAVAVTLGDQGRLLLYRLGDLDGEPRVVELPGPVGELAIGEPGELLAPVPATGTVLRLDAATGSVRRAVTVPPGGAAMAAVQERDTMTAAVAGSRLVVSLGTRVSVFDGGDAVSRAVDGFAGPPELVTVGSRVAVLDRPRTALATIDPGTGERGPALRAGDGAAHAVADRYGRVLVTDTRGGELLAFTAEPMIMRQRYPVPGAPYAIAYDPARDLAWVTLTERNEVVGFDVAGGEPVERYRFATVRQPDAVAVDSDGGVVLVASGTGEGIQVVRP